MAHRITEIMNTVEESRPPRKTNKSKGFGLIIHITDNLDPAFTKTAAEYDCVKKAAVVKHDLLADDDEYKTLLEYIRSNPGAYVSVDLKARLWLPDQVNKGLRQGGKLPADLEQRRARELVLLDRIIAVCSACLNTGGEISFAMPAASSAWLRDEVLSFTVANKLIGV